MSLEERLGEELKNRQEIMNERDDDEEMFHEYSLS